MTAARRSVYVPPGFSPRLLRADAAALYVGFGREYFEAHVGDIFPAPLVINGEKRWDVRDLDACIDRLKGGAVQSPGGGALAPFEA